MLLEKKGKLLRWDFCTVSLKGGQRPPDNNSCPYSGSTKQNGLPLYPQRLGHPACHRGRLHQSTVRSPQFTPLFLSLPSAVCSAKQNNVKQSPNYPGLTAFTCDPHSLDEALTNRVGIKPSAYNEVKWYKKSPKTVTDWSFDHLLGTLGPLFSLNACTALTHLSVWACKDVICFTQYSYCTCETQLFLLLKNAAKAPTVP